MRRILAGGVLPALTGVPLLLLDGRPAVVFALLASTMLALVGAATCGIAARRAAGRTRGGWALLGVACLSWGLGNAYWSYSELLVQTDGLFPSPADIGFLIFPVAGGAGLWLVSGRSLGSRLAGLFDGLIVALSMVAISSSLVLASVWSAGSESVPALAVSLAYPIGDVVLATMAILLATRLRRGSRTVAWHLIVGLLSMAAADTMFAIGSADGSYVSGAPSDAGWVMAFASFAAAGWLSARRSMSVRDRDAVQRWQLLLPYVPFVAAAAVGAVDLLTGQRIGVVQAVTTLAGFVLITMRQLITVLHNSRLTEQLRFQASRDPLTGLDNRTVFADRLAQLSGPRARAVLLYLDLDDFKLINDTLGHGAGDDLLCDVAGRLRAAFPRAESIARLGGDEFVVLTSGGEGAVTAAGHMLEQLRQPFLAGSRTISVTASIGAVDTADVPAPVTPEELRKCADLAMYAAKEQGKNAYAVFEPSMRHSFDAEMLLRADLRQAVVSGQLTVAYQPIVMLTDGRIAGVEALVRWNHPDRGPLSPATFIPVAERAGLIDEIGYFVLDRACAEFARWAPSREAYLSVNVSPLQLLDTSFPQRVVDTVRSWGLRPDQLVLEVTENALADEASVVQALHRLRAAGLRIAIDDFGTGYASLRYLRRLPADIVKIDRSYIQDIQHDRSAVDLVETLCLLFEALGLSVVAEGVEEETQAGILTATRCAMAQGYLFGRPGPLEHLSSTRLAHAAS